MTHCYRQLAIKDLFAETRFVNLTAGNLNELDALEEIGWVVEPTLGLYTLTPRGVVAKRAPDLGDLIDGKSLPPGF